jgi:hypothetical protein
VMAGVLGFSGWASISVNHCHGAYGLVLQHSQVCRGGGGATSGTGLAASYRTSAGVRRPPLSGVRPAASACRGEGRRGSAGATPAPAGPPRRGTAPAQRKSFGARRGSPPTPLVARAGSWSTRGTPAPAPASTPRAAARRC